MMKKLLALALGIAASILLVTAVSAGGATPASGTANVDGNDGEWTESDFFADMYKAADPTKDVLSKLYLRYDCTTQTLYARVSMLDGYHYALVEDQSVAPPVSYADDAYVKIDGVKRVDGTYGDDDVVPDFQWVGLFDGGAKAAGWEASISLAPGDYLLNVHVQVGNGEPETSAVDSREVPLSISADCPPPPFTVGPSPTVLLALASIAMLAALGMGVRRLVAAKS